MAEDKAGMSDDRKTFFLAHATARQRAAQAVQHAPEGWKVTIQPPKRTDGQNERFHAMCGDIAKQCEWMGKRRTPAEWKVLLVSGHAAATKEGFDLVPGLEGEFVNVRESTAQMSVRRGASLIEYTRAWGDSQDVKWSEPRGDE